MYKDWAPKKFGWWNYKNIKFWTKHFEFYKLPPFAKLNNAVKKAEIIFLHLVTLGEPSIDLNCHHLWIVLQYHHINFFQLTFLDVDNKQCILMMSFCLLTIFRVFVILQAWKLPSISTSTSFEWIICPSKCCFHCFCCYWF